MRPHKVTNPCSKLEEMGRMGLPEETLYFVDFV